MKYKLKGDVLFLPIMNGVLFKNNKQSLIINGNNHTYQLVDKLIPFLDGNYEINRLIEPLSEEYKKIILDLLSQLQQADFLKDVTNDSQHLLSVDEHNTYNSHIAFLGHFSNQPIEAFYRYRKSKILACGSGQSLVHLVKSLLESGIEVVEYVICGNEETYIDEQIQNIYLYYKEVDPSIKLVKNKSVSFQEQDLIKVFSEYETIAFLSSEANLDRVKQINNILRTLNKNYILGVNNKGRYSVGPLINMTSKQCWECFMHRELIHNKRDKDNIEYATVTSILANTMVYELFQSTIQQSDRDKFAYMINGFTLKSEGKIVEQHKMCSCCNKLNMLVRE
ncbi:MULTISPECIES: hypothetical protein [unclassified Bacillus (in: firmicutes)]|uniref:hypothetical protein n=1 Tax=unclassified Bacillus (in: firmicutes) TaxID=185979 RepID=UPI000BF7CC33|nr:MULTISPECIES: hypothetical protein [unclassified Bacillus (in: firmicutes)]PEU19233.1 hypothetical protein CN525_08140 [Bacillus sp. AFS014408]PFW61614.1 hypothetical protein COL20_16705 [Bacillus sp. AFS075034]